MAKYKPTQAMIIHQLCELVHAEHCSGCDQNTCDISVAYRLGYALLAVKLFAWSGAASNEFDRLYFKLGKGFKRDAERERKLLCKEPHVTCEHCNAVIWLPDEVDYWCDSCGERAKALSE